MLGIPFPYWKIKELANLNFMFLIDTEFILTILMIFFTGILIISRCPSLRNLMTLSYTKFPNNKNRARKMVHTMISRFPKLSDFQILIWVCVSRFSEKAFEVQEICSSCFRAGPGLLLQCATNFALILM